MSKLAIAAAALSALSAADLRALADQKDSVKHEKPAKRPTVLASAPKARTDVTGLTIDTVMVEGEKMLEVRMNYPAVPFIGIKRFNGFYYGEIKEKMGLEWKNRKEDGQWVRRVPVEHKDLLLAGLSKSFPKGTVAVIDKDSQFLCAGKE